MVASCSPKLRSDPTFKIAFFFATGPPLRLRSRPPDSGFAGVLPRHCRHVIHAHLLGFWKLQNFLRPINASMKEAKARRRRRRRRRRSRSREARAELYMHSAHSRIDRPRRLTSNNNNNNNIFFSSFFQIFRNPKFPKIQNFNFSKILIIHMIN